MLLLTETMKKLLLKASIERYEKAPGVTPGALLGILLLNLKLVLANSAKWTYPIFR